MENVQFVKKKYDMKNYNSKDNKWTKIKSDELSESRIRQYLKN